MLPLLLFPDRFALSPPWANVPPLNIVHWLLSPGMRGDPEEKDLLLCLEKSDFTQHLQASSPLRPDSLGDHYDLARLSYTYL